MEYIKEGFTLPVPFNLIPTPLCIYHGLRGMRDLYREKRQLLSNSTQRSMSKPSSVKSNMPNMGIGDDQPSFYELRSQISQQPANFSVNNLNNNNINNNNNNNNNNLNNVNSIRKKTERETTYRESIDESQKLSYRVN
jgi:hypothetical protein